MKNLVLLVTCLFLFKITSTTTIINKKCQLPVQWTGGNWYQGNKDYLNINRTNFINHGICIEQKEDKYIFYNRLDLISQKKEYYLIFYMFK